MSPLVDHELVILLLSKRRGKGLVSDRIVAADRVEIVAAAAAAAAASLIE